MLQFVAKRREHRQGTFECEGIGRGIQEVIAIIFADRGVFIDIDNNFIQPEEVQA